ncbi:general stress protein CDS [Bradyrhizobium sp.]|uniref:pyridoxamine 5'-phosphate oxidase family protein n=1 Tax=Bradyrhizobium sp. TaxID=376 RepID=UPI0007C1C707|nr:pyridoxamine 5'-phosphate oxidase family protein [Bradyrhizobium sp.]CUU17983.1 general stress protein CDS [Bradyrhizobium sp.]
MSKKSLAGIAKEMAGIDIAILSTHTENGDVALGFSSEAGLFAEGIYVAVEGTAELIRDKAVFHQHWTSDLDKWFENGVDTPGIVLIKVRANRATYWKGREEGEVGI